MCMRFIVICRLSGSNMFIHTTSQTELFSGKEKKNAKYVFWFPHNFCLKTFLILRIQRDIIINFYVLLTLYLRIILVTEQLNVQILVL